MNQEVLNLLATNGYAVIPMEEVVEIRSSAFPDNHIIAAKFVAKTNSVLMIRGDFKTVFLPTYNFPILGESMPDFLDLKIEDFGLILKAGSCSFTVSSLVSDT